MKSCKITTSSLLLSALLFVTSCNEKNEVEPDVSQKKSYSLRTDYDLEEITIVASNTYDSNLFNDIYTLYIGNDYHASTNPYSAFREEAAGEDINAIPGILAKILYKINLLLVEHGVQGLNDQEMALIKEQFSIIQAIQLGAILISSKDFNERLTSTTFYGEGADAGYANAMTHAYMSNRICRLMGNAWGFEFMAAHEGNEVSVLSTMDYRNNKVGADYSGTKLSYDDLYSFARNGLLWTYNTKTGELSNTPYVPKTPRNPREY
jgi:hypothetical protein